MADLLELFKEVDYNNITFLFAISIGVIIGFASCMGSLFSTKIESLLMGKEDEMKRTSLICILMFLVFAILNCVFVLEVSFIAICVLAIVVILVIHFILWIINKFNKLQKTYLWYKDTFGLIYILVLFPVIAYFVGHWMGINLMASAVLCALIEIIITALLYLNPGEKEASIFIKVGSKKWYVYRRIDNNYLLCGNEKNIKNSTKIKLIEISAIVGNNDIFEQGI